MDAEQTTKTDANAFAMWLRDMTFNKGRLKLDQAAMATMCAAVAVCQRDDCFDTLLNALKWICPETRPDEVTELYADGLVDELSFSILWYSRPVSHEYPDGTKLYGQRSENQRPFMVGGLIYRGPERKYAGNPYKEHSWTSHT